MQRGEIESEENPRLLMAGIGRDFITRLWPLCFWDFLPVLTSKHRAGLLFHSLNACWPYAPGADVEF